MAKVKAEYTLFLGLNIILNNKMFVIFSWKRVKVLFMFKRKTVFWLLKKRPNFVVSLKIFTKRKKLRFGHQLKFSYPFIFSIWWCKPLIFQTSNIWYNSIHSLKYQRSTTLGRKERLENQSLWQRQYSFTRWYRKKHWPLLLNIE